MKLKNANKTIKITFFAMFVIIGLLAHFKQAWALFLFAPLCFLYYRTVSQHTPIKDALIFSILTYGAGTLFWLPSAITEISGASWFPVSLLYLLFLTWQSLLYMGAGIAEFFCNQYKLGGRALFSSLIFTAISCGLPGIMTITAGELLVNMGPLDQLAPVYGTIGASFISLFFVNSVIQGFVERRWNIGALLGLFLLSVPFMLPAGLDTQANQLERQTLRVLAVQTNRQKDFIYELTENFQQPASEDPIPKRLMHRYFVTEKLRSANLGSYDLVAIPEYGISEPPAAALSTSSFERWKNFRWTEITQMAAKNRVSVVGAFDDFNFHASRRGSTNMADRLVSTFYIDRYGSIVDRVPKSFLIPFVEYVPLSSTFGFLNDFFPWVPGKVERSERQTINVGNFLVTVLICYDSLFRQPFWRAVNDRSQFSLILSNDNILGEAGAWYHYMVTRARVKEYGLQAAYVGNVGYTGNLENHVDINWKNFALNSIEFKANQGEPSFYAKYLGKLVEPITSLAAWLTLLVLFWLHWKNGKIKEMISSAKSTVGNSTVVTVAGAGIFLFVLNNFIVSVGLVPSKSMLPNLEEGSRVLICKYSSNIERGDIIVFQETRTGTNFIKRVFLKPGDRYQFNGGRPIINGQRVKLKFNSDGNVAVESNGRVSYTVLAGRNRMNWPDVDLIMDDDEFFVLGDNRLDSFDSRQFGSISRGDVVGSVCIN